MATLFSTIPFLKSFSTSAQTVLTANLHICVTQPLLAIQTTSKTTDSPFARSITILLVGPNCSS